MREDKEFEVGSHKYRMKPMLPMVQVELMFKVSPILTSFADFVKIGRERRNAALSALRKDGVDGPRAEAAAADAATAAQAPEVFAAMAPVTRALASLPRDDYNFIMSSCLSTLSRNVEGDRGWVKIWNDTGGVLQFNDLDGGTLLMLVFRVLQESFSDFFPASLIDSLGLRLQ